MDALILILIAVFFCVRQGLDAVEVDEDLAEEVQPELETKLNPSFYSDENAYMEVANALGFSNTGSSSDT